MKAPAKAKRMFKERENWGGEEGFQRQEGGM